jgi:dephospho-CoA kinase
MLVVGLTGGIGSGKSEAARLFEQQGVPVIDTDQVARELVQPGTDALAEIVAEFGQGILDADGRLDRAHLRGLVFSNPERRRSLEAILHPRIRIRVRERVATLSAPYCVVVIPLLLEAGQRDLVDRVLVIDAPEALQLRRAAERDRRPEAEIGVVMATQVGREQRLAAADDVIHNDGDLEHLRRQVLEMHGKYLGLARQ